MQKVEEHGKVSTSLSKISSFFGPHIFSVFSIPSKSDRLWLQAVFSSDSLNVELQPVHLAVRNPRSGCPWVDGGAGLAGPHVTHTALVPQVANFWA
jgi:hypothetical protein